MNETKQILDAVHGYISIPIDFADRIVDTLAFQRLQYVSQSAIKSVFPSANHNRYMHSLGVFHIGQMIVKQLNICPNEIDKDRYDKVQQSYLLACLLHDVGHAPFSHTLEDYFANGANLSNALCNFFKQTQFKADLKNPKNPKPHEYASAIVSCREFKKQIENLGGNLELVCRMIIGNEYSDEQYSYENCYISLLHGDIVDADRLDYACRDVWTTGYSTATIDLTRLIGALRIEQNHGKFIVTFDGSVANEIESLMTIKEYQSHNIFSHRIIAYEQFLLVHAAELMASHLYGVNEDQGSVKLKEIIHTKAISPNGKDIVNNLHISLLSDSDLVAYLKQDTNNSYAKELLSRNYEYFALWKTRDEFYHYCAQLKNHSLGSLVQFKGIMNNLLGGYGVTDFRIGSVKYTHKSCLDNLLLHLSNGKIVKYSTLNRPRFIDDSTEEFFYCYIAKTELRKNNKQQRDKEIFRKDIMDKISAKLVDNIMKLTI